MHVVFYKTYYYYRHKDFLNIKKLKYGVSAHTLSQFKIQICEIGSTNCCKSLYDRSVICLMPNIPKDLLIGWTFAVGLHAEICCQPPLKLIVSTCWVNIIIWSSVSYAISKRKMDDHFLFFWTIYLFFKAAVFKKYV